MSDIAIKVEGLGKQYRLGEIGTGTISHDLNRWFAKLRGKEDPFAKVGEVNDRTAKGSSDYVWSLRDVSFEVKKGEVLGIIGRNGAGKSTLLKILSKVTAPTTGSIKVNGRIASLLEVGTGFHPELTGRENIFLNGAILGMTKFEIRSKFDAIVDFSGVERYIDTPVKRYSSGMYVRLAFAVSAFLEPEILIVDEVLAVGDAEFQSKCLGRMQDVSRNDGRTILFVSHNIAAVSQLCTKGLLLKNGSPILSGNVDAVIERYLASDNAQINHYIAKNEIDKLCQILSVGIFSDTMTPNNSFQHDEIIKLIIRLKNESYEKGIRINVALWDTFDNLVFIDRFAINRDMSVQQFEAVIPGNVLVPRKFKISVALDIPNIKLIDVMPEFLSFEVVDTGTEVAKQGDRENGLVASNFKWSRQS
jgi:lipopolysaccharide transport system ATP-binding protein